MRVPQPIGVTTIVLILATCMCPIGFSQIIGGKCTSAFPGGTSEHSTFVADAKDCVDNGGLNCNATAKCRYALKASPNPDGWYIANTGKSCTVQCSAVGLACTYDQLFVNYINDAGGTNVTSLLSSVIRSTKVGTRTVESSFDVHTIVFNTTFVMLPHNYEINCVAPSLPPTFMDSEQLCYCHADPRINASLSEAEFSCVDGEWKGELACNSSDGRMVVLKDGVYHRALSKHLPIAGALQIAALDEYGGLHGHLGTPMSVDENRIMRWVIEQQVIDEAATSYWWNNNSAFTAEHSTNTLIGVKNTVDSVADGITNLELPGGIGETLVTRVPNNPQWTVVDGPFKGVVVWNGTCLACCSGTTARTTVNCGDLPKEGNSINGAYTNFDEDAPVARQYCIRIGPNGKWKSSTCYQALLPNRILNQFLPQEDDQPGASGYIPLYAVVQFRGNYTRTTEWMACGRVGICRCTGHTSGRELVHTDLVSQSAVKLPAFGSRIDCKFMNLVMLPKFNAVEDGFANPLPHEGTELLFQNNRISLLSAGHIEHVLSVESLKLNMNLLSTFPQLRHTTLKLLDLSNNALTELRVGTFDKLPSLEVVKLNNMLSLRGVIPSGVFDTINNLSVLGIANTNVECAHSQWLRQAAEDRTLPINSTSPCEIKDSTTSPDVIVEIIVEIKTTPKSESQSSLSTFKDDDVVITCSVIVVFVVVTVIVVAMIRRQRSFTRDHNRTAHTMQRIEVQLLTQAKETFYKFYGPMFTDEASEALFEQRFAATCSSQINRFSQLREIARGSGGIVHKANYRPPVSKTSTRPSNSIPIHEPPSLPSPSSPTTLSPTALSPTALTPSTGDVTRLQVSAVAIKSCNVLNVAANHRLLVEARLLLMMKHPAIVPLMGLYLFKGTRPWMVTSFMVNGDLKMYLRGLRQSQLNHASGYHQRVISDESAIEITTKLAGALAYLCRVGIIHGDIAARNVLCGSPATNVVLSDFGNAIPARLATQGNLGDRYSAAGPAVPFRWMAPEALLESILSHETDVWSFGVLLWEIDSYGKTPYGMLGYDDVKQELLKGELLPQPAGGFQGLYAMATKCWCPRPSARVTAHELHQQLAAMLKSFALSKPSEETADNTLYLDVCTNDYDERPDVDEHGSISQNIQLDDEQNNTKEMTC